MLELYARLRFSYGAANVPTVVDYATTALVRHGLKREANGTWQAAGFRIYPPEVFSPKSFATHRIRIMPATRTIHHFAASWQPGWKKACLRLWALLADRFPAAASAVKAFLKHI